MPVVEPVYQPTTITYDEPNDTSIECTELSQNGANQKPINIQSTNIFNRCCGACSTAFTNLFTTKNPRYVHLCEILTVCASVALLAIGLIIFVMGMANYTRSDETKGEDKPIADLIYAIIGAIMFLTGVVVLGNYIRIARRKKLCSWWHTKDLSGVGGGGSIQNENGVAVSGGTMNPSTDLLVTAQYTPVSEIAYQPPAVVAAEERSKLMSDSKDCEKIEENEKMLSESDPRIVLKPKSNEENA